MVDNPDSQACGNCLYFHRGYCRINPPTVLTIPSSRGFEIVSKFPAMDAADWCGVWKDPNPPPADPPPADDPPPA